MAEMSGFSYNNTSAKTSNGPMIAGVVAGLIVGLCVLLGAFLYGRRKTRRRNQDRDIELGQPSNGESRRRKPIPKGDGDMRKNSIANAQLSTSSKVETVKVPSRQQKREEVTASRHVESEEMPISRYPAI
jgi:hypothetical protein